MELVDRLRYTWYKMSVDSKIHIRMISDYSTRTKSSLYKEM